MKNKSLKLVGFFACVVAALSLTAAELQKGIDLTGQTSVTASQLNQLVDNAWPATNRGFVYVSNAAPDTVTYPKFTNYLWLDISALPYSLRSYNTGTWASASIGANSVNTGNIVDGAVTNPKLAANAVNTTNISDNAVAESKIAAGAVTTSKLLELSVTTAKINDLAVTTGKINDGAVTAAKLAPGAVNAAALGAQSVYGTNLVNGTVTFTQIAGGTISGTNIAGGTISGTNIAGATISKTNLSFGTPTNAVLTGSIPAAGATLTLAHSLGVMPQLARVVLVNVTTDIGWSPAEEVSIESFNEDNVGNPEPAFAISVNSTNVTIVRGNVAGIAGMTKSSGVNAAINTANWTVKAYVTYLP